MTHKPLRVLNAVDSSDLPRPDAPAFLQPRAPVERNPCRSCLADCCRQFYVHLSAYEAARLSCVLALPLDAFLDVQPFESYDEAVGLQPYHAIELDRGPSRLAFKRQADGGCVFLWHAGRRGRCGVHPLRPGLCRQYPFDVEWGDERFAVGNDNLCGSQWTSDEARAADIADSLTAWRADLEKDRVLVEEWNGGEREDRSLAAFGSFVIERCVADFGVTTEDVVGRVPKRLGERFSS